MSIRLNECFISLLETLNSIMLKRGEIFRARAYQKAQETILSYPGDIIHYNQLKGLPSIGKTILESFEEYSKTKTLDIIEKEKNNPATILSDIYGVGPKKAQQLVESGITSISQLRNNQQLLNDVQKVGLQYYEVVLKRIPRNEIEIYRKYFEDMFVSFKTSIPDSKFEIVGSYRRGAETSGDIDVIITSSSTQLFKTFIDLLVAKKVIREILSRGSTKCLVIAKIPESTAYRRVDFLFTSLEEFPFAILYFTGSKIFNTVMRHRAQEMGFTMNEHGLYKIEENGKKGEKVEHNFVKEKDIFDYLKMEYKTPIERIDGRAVIKISLEENTTLTEAKNEKKEKKEKKQNTTKKNRIKKKLVISELNNENEHLINDVIQTFRKLGIKFLDTLNETQITEMYNHANKVYRNSQDPKKICMTDTEFDILEDYIKKKYSDNKITSQVGANPPIERNKVRLPYTMGSMDKIKPDTNAISIWESKNVGPYVISCKLDGVSSLYTTEGSLPKLYTRGDGTIGQDISHLIPYLRLPQAAGLAIRGELIVTKADFTEKYKDKFANPRNMVSGITNQKTISEAIKDVHFVAYEVINPVKKSPSEQMHILSKLDIECVFNKCTNELSNELLSKHLIDQRQKYEYEIDGIIVANDSVYERKTGNPEHAFAFKMVLSEQIAEAKVVDVIWTPSKDGYLKPRVQIEPIQLCGVRIEYATGFNGAFIKDNKIGIGAVIEVIRSGDVIPHIRRVIVPAEYTKMPDVLYKWNETKVDIILEESLTDETVREKIITGFFRGIEVDGLSSGNVARIIKAGYDTVPAILNMTLDDFLGIDGFKLKMATKLHSGICKKIEAASLTTLMSASNLFGRGFSDKKIELIMECPETLNILLSDESKTEKVEKILNIKGFSDKSAEAFVERIPRFIKFMHEAGLQDKLLNNHNNNHTNNHIKNENTNMLYGKTLVMTGFRDKEFQDKLKMCGAKVGANVTKNTFLVIVKSEDDLDPKNNTSKIMDAKKLGIQIMTLDECIENYFTN